MSPFSLESQPKELKEKAKILVEKATDPSQYDSLDLDWEKTGAEDSPTRRFFRAYLRENMGDLKDKSVIDIGSGTGHLFKLLSNLGAEDIEGLEPSRKNAEISRKLYPEVAIKEKTLEEAKPEKTFDAAMAVMSFEHVRNIDSAFQKVAKFLKPRGYFYLIAGDKDYGATKRFGYEIEIEDLENGEIAVSTGRDCGRMYDILRPAENFIEAAEKAGLVLKKSVPMPPTKKLVEAEPKYKEFENTPLTHLFVFKNTGISE